MEKSDLKLLKNEIIVLNKTIAATSSPSSIYDVSEVSVKTKDKTTELLSLQTKPTRGGNSIYVEAFQVIRTYPTRAKFNCFDAIENQLIKPAVMLKAHLVCMKEINNLPREISRKDKKIKFDKKYGSLFKKDKNYEKVFQYNLFIEENFSKDSPKKKLKKGEEKLFKKYGENSKKYLRENLFENPCIIKSEKCQYLDTDDFVTIYYDEFTDLFVIVDLKKKLFVGFWYRNRSEIRGDLCI
jgi:hypothetical protein